jgi:murein DD-endopeptidase MepM/ murein hydrolase activator NlpD
MDRERVFFDIEAIKRDRKVEKTSRHHVFMVLLILAAVCGTSVVIALAFPDVIKISSASSPYLFQSANNTQKKVVQTVERLSTKSSLAMFSDQLSLVLAQPKSVEVASITNKPVTSKPSQQDSIKTQSQTQSQPKIQTPKPATPKTTTQPPKTQTAQTKPKTSTPVPAKPKTTAKPQENKVVASKPEKKTILHQDDVSIPIPAMQARPADAQYGIPENWPMDSPVSAPYGYLPERGRFHAGVDLEAPLGTPIEAAGAGKVIRAEWYAGYGLCVDIEHANGYITRYGHFTEIYVKKDQWVSAGEWIGACGSTGNSSCPHLHFEIYKNGSSCDPERISWTMRRMPPKAY